MDGGAVRVGSACFLVASVASQWASTSRPAIGVVFFVGSLLFTAAAYLQYGETVNVHREVDHRARRLRLRPASWEPKRIDWLASAIQLAGTVLFNVSTFLAMQHGLTAKQADLRVWAPDAFGSVCFLAASALAYAEVCHRWWCVHRHSTSWWIVALNLGGSVAFGVAAIASLVEPSTDALVNTRIANAGTSLGAVCFLIGAILLVPEARQESGIVTRPPSSGGDGRRAGWCDGRFCVKRTSRTSVVRLWRRRRSRSRAALRPPAPRPGRSRPGRAG